MTTLSITIQGDAELAGKLNAFTGGSLGHMNLTRSMRASGQYLSRFFAGEVFASRGRVIGRPWQPLNERYSVWKAEQWPGRPPLIRTGLMNSSFKHKSGQLSTQLYNEATYFKYHNEGWGVPERVMMRVDQQRAARVVKFILSDITTQMRSEGLL